MSIKLNAETGWLDGVRHMPSPNFDDRPEASEIDLVVVHGISLPPRCYGGGNIDDLFMNKLDCSAHPYFEQLREFKVSAHICIVRTGVVTQYVSFYKRAWHAGKSFFQGRERCNDFSIGIELEGADDEAYELRQYAALVEVIHRLQDQWPLISVDRIVGHMDIAPGRKTDPGHAFDWKMFRAMLNNNYLYEVMEEK